MTATELFGSVADGSVTPLCFLACLGTALVLGALLSVFYYLTNRSGRGFTVTLAVLPAVVCVVILLVNGNLGAGVAVAGAFSLVRFRSAPGTAREIGAIFLAMAVGLATGMGYLAYAVLFTLLIAVVQLVYEKLSTLTARQGDRLLRITIPEDLNYAQVFDDLFDHYTTAHRLTKVKTTHLGSLFRLTYTVTLRDSACEKEFLDALRCRNGNLEICCSLPEVDTETL